MKTALRLSPIILIVIVAVLVVLRLALTPLALSLINEQLRDAGDFRGHVDGLDLSLLRGEARLRDIRIEPKLERIELPIFQARGVSVNVEWTALLRGRGLVGSLFLDSPVVNYIGDVDLSVPPEEPAPAEPEPDWREKLERMFPVTFDEILIRNGRFSYRLYGTEPPVHAYVTGFDGFVRNLTNEPGRKGRFAEFRGTGMVMEQGLAEVSGSIDPLSELDFMLHLRVLGMALTSLNPMTRAFAKFDFRAGTGDFVLDIDINDGQVDGYIKPLLHDADIFQFEQDVENENKGLLRGLWEGALGLVTEAAENQPEGQFASEIHLTGNIFEEGADQSPVQALMAILQNGFVEAFSPTFEQEAGE